MVAHVINGREIAQNIQKQIAHDLQILLKKYQFDPRVVTVKVGNDPSSELYLRLRDKACKSVGIQSEHAEFKTSITEKTLLAEIRRLNQDPQIKGIMVQYPLPQHISQFKIMNSVNPSKDVEGLNPENLGKTLLGNEHLIPCTPLAVLQIIEHESINLQSKQVVIVNHSNIVGKPLAILCLNRNATTTICHVFTHHLKEFTKSADILITATGKPGIITIDHVKKDSIIIDVGIAPTKDGVKGDVNFNAVKDYVHSITPVPGGVGPVTIASSISNMMKIFTATIA